AYYDDSRYEKIIGMLAKATTRYVNQRTKYWESGILIKNLQK
ncbi:15738_t:CDS:1, partial [Acaulospora morrowiae]